jgi:hypothetical protein
MHIHVGRETRIALSAKTAFQRFRVLRLLDGRVSIAFAAASIIYIILTGGVERTGEKERHRNGENNRKERSHSSLPRLGNTGLPSTILPKQHPRCVNYSTDGAEKKPHVL